MRFLLPLLAAFLATSATARQPLPPEIDAALAAARLPRSAVTIVVADVDPARPPRVSHRAQVAVNPASIAKLTTTLAALDTLGPAFTWSTPVLADGPVQAGVLQGNLYLQGRGDPKLVQERLWLALRHLRGLGVDRIAGDIVLDQSAFAVAPADPAAFDNEPLRPYNAGPEALLLNYKSVLLGFVPQADGTARVLAEPPLAGVEWPATVPLSADACADWRTALRPDFSDPQHPRLAGQYAAACGERTWPLAWPDPRSYAARAVAAAWGEAGGQLGGAVRDGVAPPAALPLFTVSSPPLAEVVRDINKFSNNVMAQQLFLTLGLQLRGSGTREAAREVVRAWWRERIGGEPPQVDNGSGLSRDERLTAEQLVQLLQYAWASPVMPEFVASLPIAGTDGTLRRTQTLTAAHLKTGSLRDVWGVAGYVHAGGGRRQILVAIANHPNAAAMRGVVDALLAWAARAP